jgi:hypothetical protein
MKVSNKATRDPNIDPGGSTTCQANDTMEQWEDWWWRDLNEQCKSCQRGCKQSNKAEIVHCPQFQVDLRKNAGEENEQAAKDIIDPGTIEDELA